MNAHPAQDNAHSVSLARTADEELHVIEGSGNLVFSPDYKRLYFEMGIKLLTLDIESETIIQEYSLEKPRVAGTSPDGKFLYASDTGSQKILVIDTQLQTITEGYEIGAKSVEMVASPDGRQLFAVPEESAGSFLLIIDSATQTLIKKIAVGLNPNSIVVHPQRPRVYVACVGVSGEGKGVYAIDTKTYQVTHIPLEGQAWEMAISPTGDELYVTQYNSGPITVIDTLNNGVKKTFAAGESPRKLSLSLDEKWLYILSTDNRIDVFNTQNQQFVRTIRTTKESLNGIQTRKDNGAIWVTGTDKRSNEPLNP
jgi:Uncharacterized conserved protein